MAKLNPKAVLKPAVSLFLICLIVTALLAGVNMLTADRIAALAVQTAEDSQKVVLPNAASFEEVDEDTVKGLDGSGQLAGYVITTEAKGYGGTIEVMTGITADGSVSGVVLLSQNETPGLGANATKESFTGQYQQAVPESGFEVIKSGGAAGFNDLKAALRNCLLVLSRKAFLSGVGAEAGGFILRKKHHAGNTAVGGDAGHNLNGAAVALRLCSDDIAR